MFGMACHFDCCFVPTGHAMFGVVCQSHVGDCCFCSSGLVCGLRSCGMMEGWRGRGFPGRVSALRPKARRRSLQAAPRPSVGVSSSSASEVDECEVEGLDVPEPSEACRWAVHATVNSGSALRALAIDASSGY
eukprot:4825796-Amphidinium_carterae.4